MFVKTVGFAAEEAPVEAPADEEAARGFLHKTVIREFLHLLMLRSWASPSV